MSATTTRYARSSLTRLRPDRVLGVAGATASAVVVWSVAVPMLGIHLLVRFGSGAPQTVGVGVVASAALVASLCAWGLLALLERRSTRARTIWTAAALVVLVVSLSLPLAAGTTTSTRIALALMHLAAASILIPSLRRKA